MLFNLDGMLEYEFIDSLKYKSYAFHEEEEWRLFLSAPPRKDPDGLLPHLDNAEKENGLAANTLRFLNDKLDFHATETDLISFCAIPFDELSKNPLKSLWIGPKNEMRESDISLYLKLKGYEHTNIRFSDITYH